jgi:IclR family acetate operon transcriptional repressor
MVALATKLRNAKPDEPVKTAPSVIHVKDNGRDDRYFARAVSKSFDLLDLLSRAGASLSLNELAAQVDLTKSSTFRLLQTLRALGYVSQDSETRYSLEAENWISPAVQTKNALLAVARDQARDLRTRFQETVSLAVLYANHIEVVLGFESPRMIRMANTLGGIIPPHASSLGKAILAFQPQQVQSRLIHSYGIRRFTEHTITDEVALLEELALVRRQGHAVEDEEAFLDGCCVGCPIFAGRSSAVAAISTSMPKFRFPQGDELKSMIASLKDTARAISDSLQNQLRAR